jgi:rhodanese-related sulfurtransferase
LLERDIDATAPRKDAQIVLYCQGGGRSALAADTLQKMGYSSVYSLAGGFMAYQRLGLPVEK